VEVVGINPCDHPRIKAIATIQLVGVVKVYGIKIVEGEHGPYCVPPNQSYIEDGLRKWTNILTFERELWKEIQGKILKRYQEEFESDTRGKSKTLY